MQSPHMHPQAAHPRTHDASCVLHAPFPRGHGVEQPPHRARVGEHAAHGAVVHQVDGSSDKRRDVLVHCRQARCRHADRRGCRSHPRAAVAPTRTVPAPPPRARIPPPLTEHASASVDDLQPPVRYRHPPILLHDGQHTRAGRRVLPGAAHEPRDVVHELIQTLAAVGKEGEQRVRLHQEQRRR